jgi:CRP-like cAMP-binding protein
MKAVSGQLAWVPIFRGFLGNSMVPWRGSASARSSRKGEWIFSEGDKGTGFYVVVTGPGEDLQSLRGGEEATVENSL